MYDPTTGRWLTEDPSGLGPDSNPYRYVGNDPTNATDPSGLAAPPQKPILFEERNPPLRADYTWQNNSATIDWLEGGIVDALERKANFSVRYEGFVTATITKVGEVFYSPDRATSRGGKPVPEDKLPTYRITVTDDSWDRPDWSHNGRINPSINRHMTDMAQGNARWIYFQPKGITIKETAGTALHSERFTGKTIKTPTVTWTWDFAPGIGWRNWGPEKVVIAIATNERYPRWLNENLVIEYRIKSGQPQIRLEEVLSTGNGKVPPKGTDVVYKPSIWTQ